MYSVLIEIQVLIWWILQPKDYTLLGCNEILFWLQSCSSAAGHYSTELFRNHISEALEDAISLLVSFFFFSPIQMFFLVSKYFIDAGNKAFPSWFCPAGQKLWLWFINTVNLALRLLVLDPKCHRQVMQSADSIQTASQSSDLSEDLW